MLLSFESIAAVELDGTNQASYIGKKLNWRWIVSKFSSEEAVFESFKFPVIHEQKSVE